jgi:hypothetical protein
LAGILRALNQQLAAVAAVPLIARLIVAADAVVLQTWILRTTTVVTAGTVYNVALLVPGWAGP